MSTTVLDSIPPEETSSVEPPAKAAGVSAPAVLHRIIIEPPKGWQWLNLRELWQYRELLFFLCWRDVKVRYKQTFLGAAWAILQPAMMMIIFSIFFGRLANVSTGDVPGPVFYLTGLLPWFFFTSSMSAAANSVLNSERLITKIYFPRLAVPLAAVGAPALDFFVACGLLSVVCLAYGAYSFSQLLLAPVIFGIIALFSSGLGILFAGLNVSFRDFRYIIPFIIQMGMFATPTIWMQPKGDETGMIKLLLDLNPMTSLITAFRQSILGGPIPWVAVLISGIVAISIFLFGCFYFRKVEDRFADVI